MVLHNTKRMLPVVGALTVFLVLFAGAVRGESAGDVDQTIRYLIDFVSGSGMTFIRNTREYTSSEAAAHMTEKYRHFREDIETPDDFIKICATKSLLSGKPYLVVSARGAELKTGDWLRMELAAYRARSQ